MAINLHPTHLLLISLSIIFLLPSLVACSDDADRLCPGTSPASCPINCFRPDPVCGEDGVTYWCGCPDAACSGARVVARGACQIGNAGSASVPGQALLLVHIVWLVVLGVSVLFGLF